MKLSELVDAALRWDKRALARVITVLESGGPESSKLIAEIYPKTGNAHVVGITGPPGSGKSTLVKQVVEHIRRKHCDGRLGVIAVDPTSPFSGGAILGDRIRMSGLSSDPGVFIRSMGSRGDLGGLSRSTSDVIKLLDACGCRTILVETVGAGQGEVGVASTAHTCVVVLVPGMGDEIQMFKAGLMEIADIFVVNKADHGGAERREEEIRELLGFAENRGWRPPVVRTIATRGVGVDELVGKIGEHWDYLRKSGVFMGRERRRCEEELRSILTHELVEGIKTVFGVDEYREMVQRIVKRQIDPYTAAKKLVQMFGVEK